ncbi:MAG: low molecular weight phosphotyrosine protein phosphatase [Fimbriimonadaceae bacterium]|nr:low molecular weight phosphotyrosine protein phosphatase [Chitinophagales bacterium]
MKILMVCLGNICRSPMAEGIMQSKIEKNNLPWTVESAGTVAYHAGEQPDHRAQKELKKYGIDITHQRARKFSAYMFNEYDVIFTMDASNYIDVMNLAKNDAEKSKVHMIMNIIEPDKNRSVPDPYFDDELYTMVYEMLDKVCDAVIEKYKLKTESVS